MLLVDTKQCSPGSILQDAYAAFECQDFDLSIWLIANLQQLASALICSICLLELLRQISTFNVHHDSVTQ